MKGHYRRPGSSPRPTTHPAIWATAAATIALAAAACSSTSSTTSPVTSGSAAAAASNGPGGHAPTLTGAGSTFDAPFFAVAFTGYQQQHPGVTIGYSAVGSSAGITAFSAGQVNFGASDMPMTATEQAAAKGGPVTQVPVDLGPVFASGSQPASQPYRMRGCLSCGRGGSGLEEPLPACLQVSGLSYGALVSSRVSRAATPAVSGAWPIRIRYHSRP